MRHAGSFGLMDMHGWVVSLLPDVPPTPVDMNEAFYVFNNTLLGTQLTCRQVEVQDDNQLPLTTA
jgi:hypothetical protein